MPLPPQPLLFYLAHPSALGAEALGDARAALQGQDSATLKPTYRYVQNYLDNIAGALERTMTNAPEQAVTELPLRFVDVNLFDELFGGSEPDADAVVRLAYVMDALGARPQVTPYDIDEFKNLIAGNPQFYHDAPFILTLRAAAAGVGTEYGALLLHALPLLNTEESVRMGLLWDEALIFSLMLHTAWRYFPVANERDQQFLLQNYFYHGIAAGVPVRVLLIDSLTNSDNPLTKLNGYLQFLLASTEMVPTTLDVSTMQTFSSLLRTYFASTFDESIATLDQEKFMANWYRIGEGRETYRGWLRQALNIALHLKKGDITTQ